ncbi:SDR family NAD(P)-dependent oxidoreductase [Paenibacillus sp. OV219]|uniref:SDR family NAD(P)-dependent oxidoreductase n=1 Tax=Paenibacillus sp. OV219 TaxID=1884377 RepID=UPI0008C3C489|nr:SDR family NAD(P)-dependent oxidoreductase [Paenibacillus sp. OV219]SEN65125.1 Polysaccharide biosynthesis protein [Paenibacillus sp. OV219]
MKGFYTNKKILITGGTGTIGQALVRQLLLDNPSVIRIFSRDEYKQFEMQQSLSEYAGSLRYLIGDVRDADRVSRAMEGIDIVFHLAGMKHVPACEYNPFEAVQTNVIGTQNIIQAALRAGVEKVLFTSTDKAVSPANTYGATKLTAERLISAAGYQKGSKSTIFASVRFGNVMGSRGSVIPLFKTQILERGKISVTDMQMTRFMMTPLQAISLMLEANEISKGGEVFVLKMPLVKLSDLVEVIIEEVTSRHQLMGEVRVDEIGLRRGEKMDEELMTTDERHKMLEKDYMYIIPPIYTGSKLIYEASKYNSVHGNDDIGYRSNEVIGKEKLRQWLINEELL